MKKCDNCGAVQDDARTVCLDCGELLGRAMTDAEEHAHEAALSDKLTGMSERTEDFHVTPTARVLGMISIMAALVLAVMLPIISTRIERMQADYLTQMGATAVGDGSYIVQRGDSAAMVTGDLRAPAAKALEKTLICAVFGFICFGSSALFLLVPQVMWRFSTLRWRLWFDAELRPTFFAASVYAVCKYGFFGLGCAMLAAVLARLL
ncbi:MAG: hypothetical protein IKD37_07385 [Clostridia bacterium]|nr:hypothetical protein [Clostridia bacterium]